jgi:hypothetical protein
MLALVAGLISGAHLSAQTSGAPPGVDRGAATLTGTVRGRFLDGIRPLPFATISTNSGGHRRTVAADSTGRYTIVGLPQGDLRLHAAYPGHAPVELTVRVPSAGIVSVDLELAAAPILLEAVDVRTGPVDGSPPEAGDRIVVLDVPDPEFEVRMLEVTPAIGEAGMLQAVQAAGGNDPSDPSDVLFMRGSTAELKLVLLDGIPVLTPFHVAGLMRTFEPAVLGSAKLHVGGAPARYDGGLTHILDLHTRSARRDRVRASGSVDMLSSSVAAEVPLSNRAGVIVSGRGLHGLGQDALGGESPYGYRDLLVSVDGDLTSKQTLRATAFLNDESVRLDFVDRPSDAAWSNRSASLAWSGSLGDVTLRAGGGGSGYQADLPLQPTRRPGETTQPDPLLASASSDRVRATAEAEWGAPGRPNRVGISAEELRATFSAQALEADGALTEGARVSRSGVARSVGAFVDVTRRLAPGVTLRTGLRGDAFSGSDLRLAPRVAIAWEAAPNALLTVAAGRYHQVARSADGEVDATLGELASAGAARDELLPVATADHVVLSLDQQLGSVSLGIEGFWKRFEGLGASRGEEVLNSGLDLRIRSVTEPGTVWVGYGLSWFWSPLDLSGRSSEFAGRHLLSAGLSRGIGGPLRVEARLAYGAGLPSTSIPFGVTNSDAVAGPTQEGAEQLTGSDPGGALIEDSFLRLDLEVHALLEPEWGGRPWRVRPYLRVLNALDRRDALFYTYQPWRADSVRSLAERPFLPVVGVSFSF